MAEKCETSPSDNASSPKQEDSTSEKWWGWISSAKSKSAEVYTMVKKDLAEIGTAVKCEASHVLSSTSNVIGETLKLNSPESPANVIKKSFSTFIGQVSTVLNPEPDDEDDTEVILSSGDTTMLSTYKKELEALQRVDATYMVGAEGAEFSAWRASLESDSVLSPSAAGRRLRASPLLLSQYERLVPDAVTHEEFWERYLFRVALLQDRLAAASRRQPEQAAAPAAPAPPADPVLAHLPLTTVIEQSPKKVVPDITTDNTYERPDVDNVVWDSEDFANDVELTEEQQILLLEEYEKEISSKKIKPSRDITNNNALTDKQTKQRTKNRSPIKGKTDECGNNLVEDYFGDEGIDDANSDESWEKEFEIEEPVGQKA